MTDLYVHRLSQYTYKLIPRFEQVFSECFTMKDKEARINYYIRSIHDIAYTAYKNSPYTADMKGVNWYHLYRLITFKNYLFASQLIVYE